MNERSNIIARTYALHNFSRNEKHIDIKILRVKCVLVLEWVHGKCIKRMADEIHTSRFQS